MVSFFHRTLGSANRKKECERERKRERRFPTRFAGPNQCPHWSLPWRFFREQQRKKKTTKPTKRKKKEEAVFRANANFCGGCFSLSDQSFWNHFGEEDKTTH
ncbi:hypothetical protein F2Q69_00062949 [Brassica cretica]|uniref:Uncharacterized protein n=1 Tax=Brassica cretica TaxID=69181 RepID=A0A8S9RHW8_BRACR|nr:hypothetical protein F2Q69_00062949 [Brassica cretica]